MTGNVKRLIAEDKIRDALKELDKLIPINSDLRDKAILIQGQYLNFENDQIKGIYDQDSSNRIKSIIRSRIIDLMNLIENDRQSNSAHNTFLGEESVKSKKHEFEINFKDNINPKLVDIKYLEHSLMSIDDWSEVIVRVNWPKEIYYTIENIESEIIQARSYGKSNSAFSKFPEKSAVEFIDFSMFRISMTKQVMLCVEKRIPILFESLKGYWGINNLELPLFRLLKWTAFWVEIKLIMCLSHQVFRNQYYPVGWEGFKNINLTDEDVVLYKNLFGYKEEFYIADTYKYGYISAPKDIIINIYKSGRVGGYTTSFFKELFLPQVEFNLAEKGNLNFIEYNNYIAFTGKFKNEDGKEIR